MTGLSNWETDRIDESQKVVSKDKRLSRPMLNSPYFSLLEMSPKVSIHSGGVQVKHVDMMDANFQKGIKIMPYSPLGGFGGVSVIEHGWEKAKEIAWELKKKDDRYWGHVYDAIFHEENEQRYKRVVKFTEDFNRKNGSSYTVDQMMNAYVLAHPRTDFLALGPLSVKQLKRTVGALELAKKLKSDDLDYLYKNP